MNEKQGANTQNQNRHKQACKAWRQWHGIIRENWLPIQRVRVHQKFWPKTNPHITQFNQEITRTMTNRTKTNQNPTMVDAMYGSEMGKMD